MELGVIELVIQFYITLKPKLKLSVGLYGYMDITKFDLDICLSDSYSIYICMYGYAA